MTVPFLDLGAQDAAIGGELRAAVAAVLDDRQFILGPHVERFEAAMADYAGARFALGVASGTDALLLAIAASGPPGGGAVVTTPFTFFATASTIVRAGARPLFADIEPHTMNLDPAAAAAAVESAKGAAVGLVPVHLFGRVAPMTALAALAERAGLWIVEDAAQAVGARVAGRMAGTFGRAGCLSFYPSKNLGGLGDGGMVLTDDAAVAARIRQERHQGQTGPYEHASLGLCSRLDALQAAALAVKLRHLDAWNAARRRVAEAYTARFAEAALAAPRGPLVLPEPGGEAHTFHQYVIRCRERDRLRAHLTECGIGTQVYYPRPLHLQPALADLGLRAGAFPEAERAAREVLALPIYPELTPAAVATVVEAIARFYRLPA
jgi:dTDP-4-amino-4,6-dideoxygalactose transaminase